jgi:hypothetical protein
MLYKLTGGALMGVKLYDDALLNKLKKWTAGTHLHLTGVNDSKRLFEVIADKSNDKAIELPLIALSRNGGYTLQSKYKQPRSFMGYKMSQDEHCATKLNAVPIGITYQLDIYTRYLEEADEYARNIVFNIINYPKLTIEIPYEDVGLTHVANIRLTTDVEDNSDVPERLIPGQFTRLTIGLDIDDAYLWDVRIKDNLSIVEGQLHVVQPDRIDKELLFEK